VEGNRVTESRVAESRVAKGRVANGKAAKSGKELLVIQYKYNKGHQED
jgi:hypothetical protein